MRLYRCLLWQGSLLLFLSGLVLPVLTMAGDRPYPDEGPRTGLVITADMQFSYAQTLYEKKDYTTAQVEFKRFVHFFPGDQRVGLARFRTGMALYQLNQFHEAAKKFNKIILDQEGDDELARESYFMQSRSFMAMDNIGYAQVVLQNYLKLAEDQSTRDRIYMVLARMHIRQTLKPGSDQLDQAENYLKLISPKGRADSNVEASIASIEKAKNAPKKNPTLSGILAIIPGGGYLYCERYKDAFVTFCLNAGLIYGAYTAFDHDNPGLGGVAAFVASGFYAGNIYGAVSAAHKFNKASQVRILGRQFNLDAGIDPGTGSYLFSLNHGF